ncbi:Os05g0320000 [Oryza sativa Japonica Group]|uniref:Os05g0320000 protein n=1 Tax=Oryza sativa subsp. japonica TaxID=39947 RepID=A0A0P0WKQ8_ORYSJ|nr:Os05g0320000 [Oryza sativa Japonica Group]
MGRTKEYYTSFTKSTTRWNNSAGGHGWRGGFGLNAGPSGGGFNGAGFQHSLGFAARPDGGGVGAGNLVFGAVPGMSAPVFPAAGGGVLPAGALLTGVAPGGGLQMAGGGVLTGVLPAGAVPTSGAPGGRLQMAAGGLQSGALLTGGVPGGGLQAGFPTNDATPGAGSVGAGDLLLTGGVLAATSAVASETVSLMKIADSSKGNTQ